MKNSEGEEVQIESAFGITESLGKLGELLELSSGGLVLANEVATVHVALPRGAGSKYRVIHHKTLPYQAVLIVQDYLWVNFLRNLFFVFQLIPRSLC